jgi:5-methylthioadenosine/S-adenosylhomocysteine deaminase
MLLQNIRFLVTQNSGREVLKHVDLRISGDKILDIGDFEPENDEEVFDCSGSLVMPGLINAHTHASMSLLRGISDNKPLQDWLEDDIFPAEDAMDADDVYLGARLACIEMLKTGTTCFNDMYAETDRIVQAVEEAGIRAVISRGLFDWDEQGEERIQDAKDSVREYQDHDLVTPGIAPHAVYSCSEELLREMKAFAEEHDAVYHIHVSETEEENEDLKDEEDLTPTQYLEEHDLLDSSVVAAHATWLSERDKELFERYRANIAHNPAANLKLGSGIAEIPELIEKGVNVSLGTDGPASNNNFNMFEEMKLTGIVHKRNNPSEITEQQVLDMATINAAEALGLEDEVGSLEEGKKADLLVIDLENPELTPYYGKQGLISNLVFSFTGAPDTVIVNGEKVVDSGKVSGLEKEEVFRKAQEEVERFTDAGE